MKVDHSHSGPVTGREVLYLAIPASLAALLQHAFRPLDQFYVSWLGREAQGALGATTFVVILVWASFALVSAGVGPLVARATGKRDAEERSHVIGVGLVAAALIYVLVVFAVLFSADGMAFALGLEGEIAMHAAVYLRVLYLTGLALAITPVIDAALIAMGNTVLPLAIQAAVLVINGLLTPLCIFYFDMGVAGAALGTTVAQSIGVCAGLFFLFKKTGLRWSHFRLGPRLRKIVRIGLPMAISTAMYSLVYWALLGTSVSKLGSEVNAALGIGFSGLEAMSWPVYMGGSVAVSSIVGRKLGEGKPEEAWRTVRMAFWPHVAMGVIAGLVFYFLGATIVRPFAADNQVFVEAVVYATVLAWSQPFVSLEALLEGVMAGAGDTKRLFWGTVPFNLLRIPLAYWFAFTFSMGAAGIWWAINLTTFAKAAAKGWMVWRGSWSRLEL